VAWASRAIGDDGNALEGQAVAPRRIAGEHTSDGRGLGVPAVLLATAVRIVTLSAMRAAAKAFSRSDH